MTMPNLSDTGKVPQVVVTGANGFLGRYVVNAFVAAGCHVLALTRHGRLEALWPSIMMKPEGRVAIMRHDYSAANWQYLFHNHVVDVICHLAGDSSVPQSVEAPLHSLHNTIDPSLILLEAVRKHSPATRVIFASSAAVYGNPEVLPVHETSRCRPLSPYGMGKLTVEMHLKLYHDLYGVRGASVRPFSAYGPGQRKQILWDLLRRLAVDSTELTLLGDGSQSRDFIYAEDVARAFVYVVGNAPLSGEAYNVAMGHEVTVQALAETLCMALDIRPVLCFSGRIRPGEPQRWVADIGALATLGFVPCVTLTDGIARTVAWWQSLSTR